jgi:hypothetical protein
MSARIRLRYQSSLGSTNLNLERNPSCAVDHLPDHPQVNRKDDESRRVTDREHHPILFEIGERDESDQNSRRILLSGIGANSNLALSIITAMPTTRLVASSGVG